MFKFPTKHSEHPRLETSEWSHDRTLDKFHLLMQFQVYEQILRRSDIAAGLPESELVALLLSCFENPEALRLNFPGLEVILTSDESTRVFLMSLRLTRDFDQTTFDQLSATLRASLDFPPGNSGTDESLNPISS